MKHVFCLGTITRTASRSPNLAQRRKPFFAVLAVFCLLGLAGALPADEPDPAVKSTALRACTVERMSKLLQDDRDDAMLIGGGYILGIFDVLAHLGVIAPPEKTTVEETVLIVRNGLKNCKDPDELAARAVASILMNQWPVKK
jgi:hypothetical protein